MTDNELLCLFDGEFRTLKSVLPPGQAMKHRAGAGRLRAQGLLQGRMNSHYTLEFRRAAQGIVTEGQDARRRGERSE